MPRQHEERKLDIDHGLEKERTRLKSDPAKRQYHSRPTEDYCGEPGPKRPCKPDNMDHFVPSLINEMDRDDHYHDDVRVARRSDARARSPTDRRSHRRSHRRTTHSPRHRSSTGQHEASTYRREDRGQRHTHGDAPNTAATAMWGQADGLHCRTWGLSRPIVASQQIWQNMVPPSERDFFGNLSTGHSPLCLFYKQQKCQNGNRCNYLHLCSHYILNNCSYGSKCKLSHNLQDPPNDKLLRVSSNDHATLILEKLRGMLTHMKRMDEKDDKEFNNETTDKTREKLRPLVCKFYNTENGCRSMSTRGKPCAHLHVCKYYIEGICKFTECKRSHSLERHTGNRNILSTKHFPSECKVSTNGDDSRKSDICPYYKKGKCLFGDKCKNLHADAAKQKSASTGDASSTSTSSDGVENSDICLFNMMGKCLFKDNCKNVHFQKPYKWIFEKLGKWIEFPCESNDKLEKAFCNPNNTEGYAEATESSANEQSIKAVLVHFDSMMWNVGDHKQGKVKRLSTPSWGNDHRYNVYSTKWLWFWQNDAKTFTEYGKSFEKDEIVKVSEVTSEAIEKQYIENQPDITFNIAVGFSRSVFQHVISFNKATATDTSAEAEQTEENKFKQVNLSSKTERMVKRRPRLFDLKQCEQEKREHAKPRSVKAGHSFPSTWTLQTKSDDGFQLIEVDKSSAEFREMADFVKKTMTKKVIVTSVKRIQNEELWEGYSRKEASLSKKYKNGKVNERRLFHGTKQNITAAICQQGFDWRLNGTAVGTKYGKGSYFARDSKYSSDYTDSKQLFIVKVLVGTSALGNTNMVRPPPRDPAKPYVDLHDSCVDNLMDPSIFVVFETSQAYPEYLVSYS